MLHLNTIVVCTNHIVVYVPFSHWRLFQTSESLSFFLRSASDPCYRNCKVTPQVSSNCTDMQKHLSAPIRRHCLCWKITTDLKQQMCIWIKCIWSTGKHGLGWKITTGLKRQMGMSYVYGHTHTQGFNPIDLDFLRFLINWHK